MRIEEIEGLRRIAIDRPEKANSLTSAMLSEIADAVESSDAAALVLTGTGKLFSAGGDLEEVKSGTLAKDPVWERLSTAVAAHRGMTIAALNGTAAGGSLGMILACDLRIAVPEAQFFYPVLKLGVLPQPSDPTRLAALVGPARARLLLMGAARVGAEEALSWGLVDRVVPADVLDEAVVEVAAAARSAGPSRVSTIREMIDRR